MSDVPDGPPPAEAGVGRLLRDLAPEVLGAVARRHRGDFALAEEIPS